MALAPVTVCDVAAGTPLWLAGLSSRVLCTRALVSATQLNTTQHISSNHHTIARKMRRNSSGFPDKNLSIHWPLSNKTTGSAPMLFFHRHTLLSQ